MRKRETEVKGERRKKIRRKETEEEEEESQTEAQPVTSNPQGTDCSSGVEECRTTRSLCLTFFNNHTTVISSSRNSSRTNQKRLTSPSELSESSDTASLCPSWEF